MNSRTTIVFAAVLLVAVAGGASAAGVRGSASASDHFEHRRLSAGCSIWERAVEPYCCAVKDSFTLLVTTEAREVRTLKVNTQRQQHIVDHFHASEVTAPAYKRALAVLGADKRTYDAKKAALARLRRANPDCNPLRQVGLEHAVEAIEHDLAQVYEALKCPVLKKATSWIIGEGSKRISKAECTGFEAGAAGVCEIVGMGPEDPLADLCAYTLVASLEYTCSKMVEEAGSWVETQIVNAAGCGSTPSSGTVPVVTGAQRAAVQRLMQQSPAARRRAAQAARAAGQGGVASGPQRRQS